MMYVDYTDDTLQAQGLTEAEIRRVHELQEQIEQQKNLEEQAADEDEPGVQPSNEFLSDDNSPPPVDYGTSNDDDEQTPSIQQDADDEEEAARNVSSDTLSLIVNPTEEDVRFLGGNDADVQRMHEMQPEEEEDPPIQPEQEPEQTPSIQPDEEPEEEQEDYNAIITLPGGRQLRLYVEIPYVNEEKVLTPQYVKRELTGRDFELDPFSTPIQEWEILLRSKGVMPYQALDLTSYLPFLTREERYCIVYADKMKYTGHDYCPDYLRQVEEIVAESIEHEEEEPKPEVRKKKA